MDRVRVNATELDCDAVVIAMGPWSGITSLGLPVPPVYGLKGHSVTITPKSALPAQALFMENVMLGGTLSAPELLTRPDGTVYLSGISEQVPLPSRARDVAPREDAGELLSDLALSLSSSFKPADINPPAACFRPVYPDGLPRMGRIPGIRGAYLASGHSCWGILNAPASGAAMAELILTGTSETVDITPFDPGRST